MLTLYFSPGACSLASHMMLDEVGAEFTLRQVKLLDGEQRTEAYMKINPRSRVPALTLDDGTILTETTAILTYLADRFPQAKLMPEEPLQRIRALSQMAWFASGAHPIFTHIRRPERFATDAAAQANVLETARGLYWSALQEIERTLGGRQYFIGDRPSVCDLYSLVFYNWGHRTDFPMKELPAFTDLKNRMIARAGVRRAMEREQCPLLQTA